MTKHHRLPNLEHRAAGCKQKGNLGYINLGFVNQKLNCSIRSWKLQILEEPGDGMEVC